MNDIHERDSAHQDAEIERRLRDLHDVVREAVCEESAAADRRLASILDTSLGAPVRRSETLVPLHRVIIAVDIEGSTNRHNLAKAAMRDDLYFFVEAAMVECGITEDLREPFFDRGDGLLALVAPADEVPKARLLTEFVPTMAGS